MQKKEKNYLKNNHKDSKKGEKIIKEETLSLGFLLNKNYEKYKYK